MTKVVNQVALLLAVVGALNWGLVGLLDFDLVKTALNSMPAIQRAVYILIGVAGAWVALAQVTGDVHTHGNHHNR